ncbi:MAG: hypothetical protein ABI862_02645 [Ilumatobacteraceae bacterium]
MPDLDPAGVVRVLNKHGVRFVVIGGIAAQLHDLPVPATVDIDVTPARDSKNLERLAMAFEELEAGLYTADEGGSWFPRTPVENWAQYDTLHLMTIYGPVDIVFTPDGAPHGYDDLAVTAVRLLLDDEAVLVITTSTWEALKQASGRAKDLEHLDRYYDGQNDNRD